MKRIGFYWVYYIFVALALAAYFLFSTSSIQWGDNGELIYLVANSPLLSHETGPLSHPFHTFLGSVFVKSFGIESIRMINPILMAIISFVFYKILIKLGIRSELAIASLFALCMTHNIYWVGVKFEVYTLNLLLILLCIYFFLKNSGEFSFNFGVLFGLSLSSHQLTLIVLLPFVVCSLLKSSLRKSLLALFGVLFGIALLYPPLIDSMNNGYDLFSSIRYMLTGKSISGSGWENSFFDLTNIKRSVVPVLILFFSLLGLQIFGFFIKTKSPYEIKLIWISAVFNLLFALTYDVRDRFQFFLPGAALFIIVAAFNIQTYFFNKKHLLIAIFSFSFLLFPFGELLIRSGVVKSPKNEHAIPFRDDAQYFLNPFFKKEESARYFVTKYAEVVKEGSVTHSDWVVNGALHSAQVSDLFENRLIQGCGKDLEPSLVHFYPLVSHCAPPQGFCEQSEDVGISLRKVCTNSQIND